AREGATMMYPAPTFVVYSLSASFTGMRVVPVPLRDDFSLDADAFIARMRKEKPALVFLAYPNNPTGVLYPQADVLRIIEAAPGAQSSMPASMRCAELPYFRRRRTSFSSACRMQRKPTKRCADRACSCATCIRALPTACASRSALRMKTVYSLTR